MLKLIIADDEVFVRFGIKTTIDWNSIGYEIVGDAENGQKALEIARVTQPDVVLTDIMMPKMNGLELIKSLKLEMPNTKVVVLSCRKDYEYVREAMQLWGAVDYLFKLSMQPEELSNLMKKIKVMIEQERIKQHEALELRTQAKSNLSDLVNKMFNDILDRKIMDSKIISEPLHKLTITLTNDNYMVICMLIDDFYTLVRQRNKLGDLKLLNFSICNIANELLQFNGFNGAVFTRNDGEYGTILNLDSSSTDLDKLNDMLCNQLQPTLMKYLNISVTCGLSRTYSELSSFCPMYEEAVEAAEHSIYSSNGSIHHSFDKEPLSTKEYYDGKAEQELRAILIKRLPEEIKAFIFNLLDLIDDERRLKPDKIYAEITEIVHTFSSVVRQYNGNMNELKDDNGHLPLDSISYCTTIASIKKWFSAFIDNYSLYMYALNEKRFSKDITRAVDFIRDNYAASIKLRDIANHIHMSETYLSSLFKKATGQYFTDYLNMYRIEKAKELLKHGSYNVNEVGELVGYASISYFSESLSSLRVLVRLITRIITAYSSRFYIYMNTA